MGQLFPSVDFSPPQIFFFVGVYENTTYPPNASDFELLEVFFKRCSSDLTTGIRLEAGSHNLPLNLFHLLHMNYTYEK